MGAQQGVESNTTGKAGGLTEFIYSNSSHSNYNHRQNVIGLGVSLVDWM